ncbi:unnamed protein product [Arabidopsis halleri]
MKYPSSFALFGEPDFSDHASCSVALETGSNRVSRPFKFYNYLLQSENFLPLVCNNWFSFNVVGSAMFRCSKKLKLLKKVIRGFSKENVSGIEKRVSEAHDKLLLLQNRLMRNPTVANAEEELEAQRKWILLAKAEESFFCQRSSIAWMKDGDSNTAYFHRLAGTRKALNHIHFIQEDNGPRIDSQQGIRDHCVEFFNNLMGSDVGPYMLTQSDMNLLLL